MSIPTSATSIIPDALAALDAHQEWLAELHTSDAIRNGGFAIWHPDVILIAIPWDPIDGDAQTMAILFCAGSPLRLAEYGTEWAARGYTHIAWCRGFKRGLQKWQKHPLDHWARLTRTLNKH